MTFVLIQIKLFVQRSLSNTLTIGTCSNFEVSVTSCASVSQCHYNFIVLDVKKYLADINSGYLFRKFKLDYC